MCAFVRFVLVFCAAVFFVSDAAHAQRLKSIPIDREFVPTIFEFQLPWAPETTVKYVVALHRLVNHENKTYVCGAFFGKIHGNDKAQRKFVQTAELAASNGLVLTTGLARFTDYSGRMRGSLRPEDIPAVAGQPATCKRIRKPWQAYFADGRSQVVIRDKVRILD